MLLSFIHIVVYLTITQWLFSLWVAPESNEIFKQKIMTVEHICRSSPASTQFGHGVFEVFEATRDVPVFCATLHGHRL